MTTYALIQPEGTRRRTGAVDIETDAAVVAEFQKAINDEGTDVVTLTSPSMAAYRSPHDPWVGWIFDWGKTMGLPVNRKAWALYGRSPIYGPMLIATDHRAPLPDEFLEIIAKPIEEWVPAEVLARMEEVIDAAE
jgi:hypothetical protein